VPAAARIALMRSRMLRVLSRTSLPPSPETGWRPVCPATKTRLPNFVAGERFGFSAALPTLTTSFLGMAFSSEKALSDGVSWSHHLILSHRHIGTGFNPLKPEF